MKELKSETQYRQTLRGRVLDVAMHAFAANGIHAVRMDDIARSLGISKRTLYELYDNKEKLLLEGVKLFKAKHDEEEMGIVEECPNVMEIMLKLSRRKIEEFRITSPQFYSDLTKYPTVQRYLSKDSQQAHARFIKFLERGVNEGYFRSDVDLELVSQLFKAVADYIMSHELVRQYSMEQIFHDFIFLTMRGFCTPDGVKMLDRFYIVK